MLTCEGILALRLRNQHLAEPSTAPAATVVAHLGAVQAQDYPAARWALAQRLDPASGDDIDAAIARGDLVRTHVLRPTWHIVAAADVRWLLALTAPAVKRRMAYGERGMGLSES